MHSRYYKFLEYGDCHDYHQKLDALRKDFDDLKDEQDFLIHWKYGVGGDLYFILAQKHGSVPDHGAQVVADRSGWL